MWHLQTKFKHCRQCETREKQTRAPKKYVLHGFIKVLYSYAPLVL